MFERLDTNSIEAHAFKPEETKIVLQRHEEFERDHASTSAGHLLPEAVEKARNESRERIRGFLEQVPIQERAALFFLVLSSDTVYGSGARSMETGQIVVEEIGNSLKENGIAEDNLLNISRDYRETGRGKTRPTANIREPLMFEETPDFVAFLRSKYPESKEFWKAYETDVEKDERVSLEAEGPEDIADRIERFLTLLKRYSQLFHRSHPESRLVIWCVSHYDTISPWAKKYVLKENVTEKVLPVDYGAGLTLEISVEGKVTTTVGEEEYDTPL